MKYIVYLTTNTVNNKIYIGVHGTEDPDTFDGYIGNSINIFETNPELKHPKLPFHKAVKKYGYSAFRRITLKVFDTMQDALDLEAWLVTDEFVNRPDTYNAIKGGGLPPRVDKVVYQYNLKGIFIKEWPSLTQAAKYYNTAGETIGIAANYKRVSFNSLWSFTKEEALNLQDYNITIQNKQVYMYDMAKTYVKEVSSMSKCARELNTYLSKIQRAIKSGNPVNGYYISLVKNDKYIFYEDNHIPTPRKAKKVGQYTMDGILVRIFNTVREAKKEFPNVGKVLRGQATHCHNFIFKYEK